MNHSGQGHLANLLLHYVRARFGRRWKDRRSFEQWQERQIIRKLRDVRAQSSYYRELWKRLPLEQWRQFPIIDKAAMMKHFDSLNTAGVRKEEAMQIALEAEQTRQFQPRLGSITVGLSSGTSGSRGLFLVSDREQAAWAGTILAKLLPGPLWKAEKIAFFLRANSNLYESVSRGKLQFQYFDLIEGIDKHVDRLNDYQPGILAAPPSVLRLLAEAKREGRLLAQPHRIISIAEVLDGVDAEMIQAAFGIPLHQVYQCTEGFLASTCKHGTLHLNEDIVHIEKEYVYGDSSGRRFVPIITDFSRSTQPIIRYRLNDLLTESAETCPCGSVFTAIDQIEGRCDDIFYMEKLADGTLMPVFPDFIARAIIAASPAIEEYRVIQLEADEIVIELKVEIAARRDEVERQTALSLEGLTERLECRMPKLSFTEYSFQPGSRKLRRVERKWRLDLPQHAIGKSFGEEDKQDVQ